MPATVPRNLIESAISRLRDLPAREAERVSRKAAIAAMRDEIQVALGKGYSLGEVAKILAQTDENFAGLPGQGVRQVYFKTSSMVVSPS